MKKILSILFLLISFCLSYRIVFASDLGLSTYGIDLLNPGQKVSYDNYTYGASSFLGGKVSSFVSIIMGFAALVVFVLVVYGGIVILFSNGNRDSYKTGLNILKTTIIGLIIILFSYAIVRFFISNVFNTTEPTSVSSSSSTILCGSNTCDATRQYCCTDQFFGCTIGECEDIAIGYGCACNGSTLESCLGTCQNCPNQICPTTGAVSNYNGYCTPENTKNHWYCKQK